MDAGWCARTVRAAVFAAVCVLLAAVGHVMMSGCAMPWWALVGGFVATGGVGWVLAGRERGLTLIAALVVGGQTVLHWGFSLAQSAVAPTASGSAGDGMGTMRMGSMGHDMGSRDMVSMDMVSMDMSSVDMSSVDMSGMHAHSTSMPMQMGMSHASHIGPGDDAGLGYWLVSGMPSLGMSGAHLVAAVLCGLWLGYGERAAYRLLRAVGGWLAAPLRLVRVLPALPRRPRRLVRRSRSRWAPYRLHLVHAITRRGPPSRTAVV